MEVPGLAGSRFHSLHGKFECDKKWSELATKLNSLGGAVKTVNQWQTVWRDLKSRTSIKARNRQRQQALTGNRPISEEPLTEFERRVSALIGEEYMKRHDSTPENIPLEEVIQMGIEVEDERVISEAPSPLRKPLAENFTLRSGNSHISDRRTPRASLKRKRMEEDGNARKKFLEIAEKQADALKILAESSSASAQANKMMAEAIAVLGNGLSATAEAFNNLTNAIYRM
ncbi:uncharacterized protein LOC128870461 [Anastrepha ludens]|uniref:uncharacterized protein LOC128870461 n=1 Tax=Anastrepha ludens TaxID=28586 RepID=UPI0023B08573|nr:uncharacterized protein LOC128870461 [Anastrepha ludens]XP_053969104.1 uncharacterized protein LOC128870461 [Anastrepha ludens]